MAAEADPPGQKSTKGFFRLAALVVGGALLLLVFISPWLTSYHQGSYILARSFEPNMTGVIWKKRNLTTAEERRRSRVEHGPGPGPFAAGKRFTEDGQVEAIGIRDGQTLFRVTVSPGPLGIGWMLHSYVFKPGEPGTR